MTAIGRYVTRCWPDASARVRASSGTARPGTRGVLGDCEHRLLQSQWQCYFLRLSNGPDFQDECLEELDEEKGDDDEDEDEDESEVVEDESRVDEVKRFEETSDERSN